MDRGLSHCTGNSDQNHIQEKEMQKEKWLLEEALQKAKKRKGVKAKERDRVDLEKMCEDEIWGQINLTII